jgi:hypothetical protein
LRLIKIVKRTRTDLKETIHNPKIRFNEEDSFLSMFFILACKPTQKLLFRHGYYDETEEVAKAANASTKCNTKLSNQKDKKKNIASQISDFSRTIIKG